MSRYRAGEVEVSSSEPTPAAAETMRTTGHVALQRGAPGESYGASYKANPMRVVIAYDGSGYAKAAVDDLRLGR